MTRYRVIIRNLFTGATTARGRLYSFEQARREVDAINEHCTHHEAWMEPVQTTDRNRLIGLLLCSLTCAAVWGIIGALTGGTVGAAVGVIIGGIGAVCGYCWFAIGNERPEEAEQVDRGRRAA